MGRVVSMDGPSAFKEVDLVKVSGMIRYMDCQCRG